MTENELLQAVTDAINRLPQQPGEVGITTAEIQDANGMTQHSALRVVKALLKAGKLRPVRVRRVRCDGIAQLVSGWAPVAAGKKK